MGYYGRLDTEEKRLAYREYEVAGFDLTHYEEEKTDVYTKDENGRYYLKIFNGTAGKPSCYYSFRSEQAARECAAVLIRLLIHSLLHFASITKKAGDGARSFSKEVIDSQALSWGVSDACKYIKAHRPCKKR